MALPISLRSSILLDFLGLICLLLIYLIIWLSESLIFLESEARYSMEL